VSIDQARDWYLTITWNDSNNTPINLTGYSATFNLATSYNATTSALTLTSASGITLGGAAGTIAIHATPTQTSISAGTYFGELVLTSGSAVQTSLLKGQLTVNAKVI
jgi:hypothetical protein